MTLLLTTQNELSGCCKHLLGGLSRSWLECSRSNANRQLADARLTAGHVSWQVLLEAPSIVCTGTPRHTAVTITTMCCAESTHSPHTRSFASQLIAEEGYVQECGETYCCGRRRLCMAQRRARWGHITLDSRLKTSRAACASTAQKLTRIDRTVLCLVALSCAASLVTAFASCCRAPAAAVIHLRADKSRQRVLQALSERRHKLHESA